MLDVVLLKARLQSRHKKSASASTYSGEFLVSQAGSHVEVKYELILFEGFEELCRRTTSAEH